MIALLVIALAALTFIAVALSPSPIGASLRPHLPASLRNLESAPYWVRAAITGGVVWLVLLAVSDRKSREALTVIPIILMIAIGAGLYLKKRDADNKAADDAAQRARMLNASGANSKKTLTSSCLDWYSYSVGNWHFDETTLIKEARSTDYLLIIKPRGSFELWKCSDEPRHIGKEYSLYDMSFTHNFVEGDRIEAQSISYEKKRIKEISREQASRGFSNFDRVTDSGFNINLVARNGIITPLFPVYERDQIQIANMATMIRNSLADAQNITTLDGAPSPKGMAAKSADQGDGFDL